MKKSPAFVPAAISGSVKTRCLGNGGAPADITIPSRLDRLNLEQLHPFQKP
jgi:hypothetical protein